MYHIELDETQQGETAAEDELAWLPEGTPIVCVGYILVVFGLYLGYI